MQIIRKFSSDGVTLSSLYKRYLVISIDESIGDCIHKDDDGGKSDDEEKK